MRRIRLRASEPLAALYEPPRACRFFRREIRLNASPPDRMGQRPSAVEYSPPDDPGTDTEQRSEEHTSELQSLMRISYAVFCLKKKYKPHSTTPPTTPPPQ